MLRTYGSGIEYVLDLSFIQEDDFCFMLKQRFSEKFVVWPIK